MKIRGGGNRPGSLKGAGKAGKAGATNKAGAARFAGMIGDATDDTEEAARKVRHQLLEELAELAKEVDDGETSGEEASRRFAGIVIKERFGDPAKTKGGEAMVDSIGEMVENDPNFVGRLSSQLKKISKS